MHLRTYQVSKYKLRSDPMSPLAQDNKTKSVPNPSVLPAGYPKLCSKPAPDHMAIFIANRTKNNYIILEGTNTQETIDCVHYFATSQGIWSPNDDVRHTRRPRDFKPDRYHDISFVLNFYNKARRARKVFISKLSESNANQTQLMPQDHDSSSKVPESRCAYDPINNLVELRSCSGLHLSTC